MRRNEGVGIREMNKIFLQIFKLPVMARDEFFVMYKTF